MQYYRGFERQRTRVRFVVGGKKHPSRALEIFFDTLNLIIRDVVNVAKVHLEKNNFSSPDNWGSKHINFNRKKSLIKFQLSDWL